VPTTLYHSTAWQLRQRPLPRVLRRRQLVDEPRDLGPDAWTLPIIDLRGLLGEGAWNHERGEVAFGYNGYFRDLN
jgi:hypothetical protein